MVDETILADVRDYLDITWEDKAGDKKLSGMIQRGISAINGKCGTEYDYTKEEKPRGLLFLHVMYERSGALDEFWNNYKLDIISLQAEEEAKRYAEAEKQNV